MEENPPSSLASSTYYSWTSAPPDSGNAPVDPPGGRSPSVLPAELGEECDASGASADYSETLRWDLYILNGGSRAAFASSGGPPGP